MESGFNPEALGDNGTSYGICQWHDIAGGQRTLDETPRVLCEKRLRSVKAYVSALLPQIRASEFLSEGLELRLHGGKIPIRVHTMRDIIGAIILRFPTSARSAPSPAAIPRRKSIGRNTMRPSRRARLRYGASQARYRSMCGQVPIPHIPSPTSLPTAPRSP